MSKKTRRREESIVNYNALKAKMLLNGVSREEMIKTLGISKSAFFRKMNGTSEFTREEIDVILTKLQLSPDDVMFIFFYKRSVL